MVVMDGEQKAQIRFRNYIPSNPELAKLILPRPEIPSITQEIQDKLAKIANEEPDVSTLSIAPKKANWDLKRELQRKLERAEVRTQRAIVEMMREKLQSEEGESARDDLNAGVALGIAKELPASDSESDED